MEEFKEISSRKRVRFSEDVADNERKSPLHQKTKKKPHYHRMKRTVTRYLHERNYEAIDLYLKSYSLQEIEEFYKIKGLDLFYWVLFDSTHLSLKYLVESISVTNTVRILSNNNFDVIGTILGGLRVADQEGRFNQEKKKLLIEKLKILLDIGIGAGIEEILNKRSITSSIKECFEIAKLEKQAENKN